MPDDIEKDESAVAAGAGAETAPEQVELTDGSGTKYNLNKADFEEYLARGPKWQDALRKRGEQLNLEKDKSKKDDDNRLETWRKDMAEKNSQDKTKETEIAKMKMKQEYEDFDGDAVLEHSKTFSNESVNDRWKYAYLAHRGAMADKLIEEARAEIVRELKAKGGRGLPQAGPPGKTEPGEPTNDEEALDASMWSLKNILRK